MYIDSYYMLWWLFCLVCHFAPLLRSLDLIQKKIMASINESATYNETYLCLYPHFDSNSIATHCSGSDKDCCDGPNGFKSLWQQQNEYHWMYFTKNGNLIHLCFYPWMVPLFEKGAKWYKSCELIVLCVDLM